MIEMVVAVAVGTTLLLGLGACAGFWAGVRSQPFDTAEPRSDGVEKSHSDQLDRCLEIGEQSRSQCEQILKLSHASSSFSPELRAAIEQLHATMRDLTSTLQLIRSPVPPVDEEKPDNMLLRELAEVSASSPRRLEPVPKRDSLTMKEITEVVGGRRNIGESTFGLESVRYPYDVEQLFAPWEEGERPHLSEFRTIKCHDISVAGMSFFLPDRPEFERLVISLGREETRIFMVAELCQHKAVFMRGDVSYLVTCRFVKRLEELAGEWQQQLRVGAAV